MNLFHLFFFASVNNLQFKAPDHASILLSQNESPIVLSKPFWFIATWYRDSTSFDVNY